ncbi:hypothetical protein ACHAXH_008540 [Discostella pseudostelligera]
MSDTDSKNECLFTIDSSIKDHAQVYLRQAIILRAQRECVLSRIVDCLSDGVNELGVTALQDLIPNLTSWNCLQTGLMQYWIGGCTVIFAVTDVKAGEELTICYHPDENSIRTHWGIHE